MAGLSIYFGNSGTMGSSSYSYILDSILVKDFSLVFSLSIVSCRAFSSLRRYFSSSFNLSLSASSASNSNLACSFLRSSSLCFSSRASYSSLSLAALFNLSFLISSYLGVSTGTGLGIGLSYTSVFVLILSLIACSF
jgi:hypothetical protein